MLKFHGTAWSRFLSRKKNPNQTPLLNHQIVAALESVSWKIDLSRRKLHGVIIILWLVNYPGVMGVGGLWVTLTSLHSSQERGDSKQRWESPHGAPWTGDAVRTLQNQPKKFLPKGGKHWLRTGILTQASSRICVDRDNTWKSFSFFQYRKIPIVCVL